MKIEDALNEFIDKLIINNDNTLNRGLQLYTTVRHKTFHVYKNNNSTIYINPVEGNDHFPQPKNRILDALNNELILSNNDLPYVKPIVEYIQKNYLMKNGFWTNKSESRNYTKE